MFVFTGASFGNLKEGGSQGSYLIFLDHTDYHCNLQVGNPKDKQCHIVYLLQKRLLLSKVLIPIFILEIFYELTNHQIPVTLFTHNRSLYDAIKSSKYFQNK